ncbi:MAG TPA: hypothetical protein DDY13_18610 [Cytophagales bacterium]|jgi:type IX secretion system PorP/SprF family membrane protein|nr:hypothetical protein [Cytophagales bacterium]
MTRILWIFILLISFQSWAQDAQFSQYYASPIYLNPGFTGTAKGHRIVSNTRMQWTSLASAFNTYAVSWDVNVDELSSGFGITAMVDKAGSVELQTSLIGATYAAKIRLNDKLIVSPGLQFGYGSRLLDFDKLILGDQLEFNGPTTDDVIGVIGTRNYFDFSSGFVMYSRLFWGGFAAHHINRPNHSLLGEDSPLPVKYSVHAGGKFPIKPNVLSKVNMSAITTSFIYKWQGSFQQLDAGFNIIYDPVMVGLWYRGLFNRSANGTPNRDALIFMLGMNLKYLEIGYSYDFTISEIGPSSGGAHELSVKLEFDGWRTKKVKRKDKFLPCPNFTGFGGY